MSPPVRSLRGRRVAAVMFVVGAGLVGAGCGGNAHSARPQPGERSDHTRVTVPSTTGRSTAQPTTGSAGRLEGVWTAGASDYPYAMAADEHGVVTRGLFGHIVALDAGGQEQWNLTVAPDPARRPPALTRDVVVLNVLNQVVVIDRATGTTRWTRTTVSDNGAAVHGDGVAIVARDGVELLDAATGAVRWKMPFTREPATFVFVWLTDDVVVALRDQPRSVTLALEAFDVRDGARRWEASIPFRSTRPVVAGDHLVYAGSETLVPNTHARAIEISSGREVWATEVEGQFDKTHLAVAAGDEVVVSGRGGEVTLLDARTGAIRWATEGRYPQRDGSRPVIAAGRVVLDAFDTNTMTFDRRTGQAISAGPLSPPVFLRGAAAMGDRYAVLVESYDLGAVWVFDA